MRRALCIWFPNWPIQRICLAQPGLNGRPAVLHDPRADLAALCALAEHCERFSPSVAVEQSPEPESLLLDITGLGHLFGGEAGLARRIVEDFVGRGLVVRVAAADTIGAAWAVAHYGRGRGEGGFQISDFRCGIADCSFSIISPDHSLDALRPLPVEALRVSSEVVGLLHQLGIRHIGQIERLPRNELPSRFGPELLRQWDRAIGRVAEPVPTHRPVPQLQAEWTAEAPTARREAIEAVLEPLVTQVAAMAVRSGHGVLRLECRLDCISMETARLDSMRVSVGLFEPSASVWHLVELLQIQLERTRLPGPVSGAELSAVATAPLLRRQQELFARGDESCWAPSRQLAALVDRLSSRLGYRAVVRARLLADAQPELAWCYRPMIDAGRRRRPRKGPAADLLPRPLRLLRRPRALATTSVAPDGPPLQFLLDRREHRIAHTWGSERIETGWWRGRAVGRDYYRIETTTGRRFWLFRRLRDGRWFVHGMFE